MAKKTHIKVRLVPEANPDSAFYYYTRKPTKGEKAKDKLFKDIDILEKNLKTLNQKNIELENYVKDMENKYGCK